MTPRIARLMLTELSVVFLGVFFYRYVAYYLLYQAYPFSFALFFKVTSLAMLLVVGLAFLINTPLTWKITKQDALFIVLGTVFLVLAAVQHSSEGFVIAFQMFLLPLGLRWCTRIRRSLVKGVLMCVAIGSAVFFILEYAALNNEWLGVLSPHSVIFDLFQSWRELYVPEFIQHAGESYGVKVLGELAVTRRPYGVNGYIVNSAVGLAMVCSFFVFEALVYGKLRNIAVAFLALAGLIISTSTTSIAAFLAAFVVMNILTKPMGRLLLQGSLLKRIMFVLFSVGCVAMLWPVLQWVFARMMQHVQYGETAVGVPYVTSFITRFGSGVDVLRLLLGGNFWELNARFAATGWQYQDTALLVRESNFINFLAFFGIVPLTLLFARWLAPFRRLRTAQWEAGQQAIPFLAAFLTGIFSMVHDHGIIFWQNTFFFFIFFEFGRQALCEGRIHSGWSEDRLSTAS